MSPLFFFFGYLGAFCCFFVAELPLTFAKLKSIPLKRARGPLNECVLKHFDYLACQPVSKTFGFTVFCCFSKVVVVFICNMFVKHNQIRPQPVMAR